MYFSEPMAVGPFPVVQSCEFNEANGAACLVMNTAPGGAATSVVMGGLRAPLFTFTATLPTRSTSTAGSTSQTKTQQPPQTSPPTLHKATVPVGAIVGAVIGSVVLVGGALGALLFCRRRRHNSYQGEKIELDSESARVRAPFIITQRDSVPSSSSYSGPKPLL
jgi:hypothetical protein